MNTNEKKQIKEAIVKAVETVSNNNEGAVANYIPELASVDPELTQVSVRFADGSVLSSGDTTHFPFTLQSTAKLVVLIGLLEDFGPEQVFSWVRVEPSGDDFSSVARLDQFGPMPSNPMLNAGAIALCSRIPGEVEDRLHWLENWIKKIFNKKLHLNQTVFASERRTGDRNRSLAYLLKSTGGLACKVTEALETYFFLCSFEATVEQASYLPMLLANKGKNPQGEQVISHETVKQVLSIMATCGLYNESGEHLVKTGMPAKSGVSGLILASAIHHGIGVAVASPRVNQKGTSVRGELILQHLSQEFDWHFAN